ncbi:MAG: GYF domain-containing protein [Luteolibacter sp.]
MSWYYSKNGMQLGPVAEEELLAKSKSGEVAATDLIWKEGMADWTPLGQVPEFQLSASTPAAMTPPPSSMGSVPMPQPAAYQASQMPGNIPTYLWQSIVATVLGALTCWLVAMPLGIVAIVFAAKVEGLQRSGDFAGATSASKSAKSWMLASYACLALFVLFAIAAIIFAVASGEFK